ncbi:MAG: UDP-N-acetylmuramate dehydrogenase [Patescibacteria group bacterium]|nr:UDP-N-acetylmuramate dehydrogenase [Patescibacteria group bacterium]
MSDIENTLEKELGEDLKKNVCLRDFVSIGVGGVADFFYVAKNIDQLAKCIMLAHELKVPYFVLGGGYNVIPSDSGFPGIVIKNESNNVAFSGDNSQVIVDSGVSIGKLINLAASRDLGGLEFLFGVPGTVGGAVYGNAGAFGYEIGDFVKSVILLLPKEDKTTIVVNKPCEWFNFAYRSSKLKTDFNSEKFKPIILTVKLQLVRRRKDEILGLMQQNMAKKKDSQPLNEKSAGSFFKNPDTNSETTAGYLLDKSGAKKLKMGGAAFSKQHANFLVNRKNASASDVRKLAEKAKDSVKDRFNVDLEEEVEYIGKW